MKRDYLKYLYAAVAIYLLTPLFVVILMSFKDGPFMGFPIEQWTFKWYAQILDDAQFISAFGLSAWIALASTLLAAIFALWLSLLLVRSDLIGLPVLFAIICLPIVVPSIVSAISFRVFLQSLGVPQGATSIIIAHTAYGVPFLVLMVLTRLRSMPQHLTEAARDLGADAFVAFLRVTLPYLKPALIGGSVFSILSSFDDFIRAFFLGAYSPTLPVLIYSRLFEGISPALAAISTLVLLVTILFGAYAERLVNKVK